MEDKRNEHLKVQELCDCYATNDYLEEMSKIAGEAGQEDTPLKWLALAALHAVNDGAKKITLLVKDDGETTVRVKYRTRELPSPGSQVGPEIVQAVRDITHIEGPKGKSPLALGIRNDSLEMQIKVSPGQARRWEEGLE